MNQLTAKPQLLKQANLTLIRKIIKIRGTATRAEILRDTQISTTTVRSLLTEMMENGEIEIVGHDKSSGGRKAVRYGFLSGRYHGAAFCITGQIMQGMLVNVGGEIERVTKLEVQEGKLEQVMITFLDELISKTEIKSIGVGVPGAVEGGSFWRKEEESDKLCKVEIGAELTKR